MSEQYFLGFDLGQGECRLCYTRPQDAPGRYSPPKPVLISGSPDSSANLKDGLLLGDERACQSLTRQAQALLQGFLETVSATDAGIISALTAGLPAGWGDRLDVQERLARCLQAAGFPAPQLAPEAAAAVHAYRHAGRLSYRDEPQRWLVVDLGAQSTRLSLVAKDAAPELCVESCRDLDWGGDLLDAALLDGVLLPRAWLHNTLPGQDERRALLPAARKLKERFCEQVNSGAASLLQPLRQDGLADAVELSREEFDSAAACGGLIERLRALLAAAAADPSLQAEAVLFTGGGAGWYFVRAIAAEIWEAARCHFPERPALPGALLTAGGLALHPTGFQAGLSQAEPPAAEPPAPQPEIVTPRPQVVEPPRIVIPPPPDRSALYRQARKRMLVYVLIGSLFALLVSPIPGGSSAVLIFLEALMLYNLARLFKVHFDNIALLLGMGGLVVVSLLSKLLVIELLTLLPLLGWAIKPVVAALVMWALGEGGIALFDRYGGWQK